MNARRTLLATLLVCTGLALPGFALAQKAPAAPNYPPIVGKHVADTKKQIKTIKMDEFYAQLQKKELGTLIDVREADEYADGFIPGAVNIPRGLLEFKIWKQLGFPNAVDMNQRITLYCMTGGRCALSAKALQDLGFTNVVGGDLKIEEWTKAGYPLVKPSAKG